MKLGILSRNPNLYSTKRLVEAAKQRGHDIKVVDALRCNLVMEKRNPRIYYQNEYLDQIEGIIPRIGASVTFMALRWCASLKCAKCLLRSKVKP